jgi:hypothetical protein
MDAAKARSDAVRRYNQGGPFKGIRPFKKSRNVPLVTTLGQIMDDSADAEYAKAGYLGSSALQKAASATRVAIASCGGKGDELADVLVGSLN